MVGTPRKVRDGQILAVSEVAVLLGAHINTVKRIPASELPYFTIGSRHDRRYYATDVETYIRSRLHRT